jgi:MSHA pilin protein MshC
LQRLTIGEDKVSAKNSGFTLIELSTIIVLVGIMSIVILPRLVDTKIFQNRGFSDQLRASVEYARKSAIALRRNVCVNFGSAITITYAATAGSSVTCSLSLINPSTGAAFSLALPSGTTVSSTLSPVIFNALGEANGNATISISGSGSQGFTILGTTGYVQ